MTQAIQSAPAMAVQTKFRKGPRPELSELTASEAVALARDVLRVQVKMVPVLQQMVEVQALMHRLTWRESDVLDALVDGDSDVEISARLGMSVKTVKHHCSSIFVKFGVHSRGKLFAAVFRRT